MSQAKTTDTKPVDASPAPVVEEDPTVGRIQVSAQRKKRFYVYVARRQFATRAEVQKVVITALGGAIASAISTAGELEQMGVGTIVDVKTSYSPITPDVQRSVARIAITVLRKPEWKPDETDAPRRNPRSRKEDGEEGEEKKEKEKEVKPETNEQPSK